jgi:hypothetical protein
MPEIKATYDGEKVILPPDFHAAGPVEVTVLFPDAPAEATSSIWDFAGRSSRPMSGPQIDAYLAELRKDWDDDPRP